MKYELVGKILASYRIRSGFTQKQVAEKVGKINAQFISNIERGLCHTPHWVLKKIIGIYRLKPEDVSSIIGALAYCYIDALSSGIGVKTKKNYVLKKP